MRNKNLTSLEFFARMNEILWSAVLRDYVYLTNKLSILVIFSLFFTPALHFSVSFFFLHAMNDEHDDTIVTSTH